MLLTRGPQRVHHARRAALWIGIATVAATWDRIRGSSIARYMADARARELPLVGGGDHDWTNLLFHWNLLHQDTLLAGYVEIVGWLGIIGVLAWLGWHAFLRESWR